MKYLMFDHMGVLNQALNSLGHINEPIVNQLNQLVDHYGYKIVFHSSNTLAGQLDLLQRLQTACLKQKLIFPKVVAIAVRDLQTHPHITSDKPLISMDKEGLQIAAFGVKKEGKACIREALSVILNIQEADRKESIVFDDEIAHIAQAQKEGYQVKYIGDGLSLNAALGEVLAALG